MKCPGTLPSRCALASQGQVLALRFFAICLFFGTIANTTIEAREIKPAPKLPPRIEQSVPLPLGVERDGFARHAAHLPIYAGPIYAPAWVLMDAESGRVLAAKNADARMFPASTTKTMTALLAVENNTLDEVATISARPPQVGESSVHLLQNEKFTLRDLVKAALIKSANDSCVAIAEAVSGSESQFVKRMNERAKELGARNTRFQNPHGLHHPQHFTTARDLALIARQAMQLPAFAQIARQRETTIHGNWKIGPIRPLLNRNRLLFRWSEYDGVKTGYTRQAGKCLIASATRRDSNGRPWRLIAVVMKSPDTWSDAYNLLVHEGFERFSRQVVATKHSVIREFAVANASRTVGAVTGKECLLPLRDGELANLRPQFTALSLRAPIERGQLLGTVRWMLNGQSVASSKLFAAHSASVAPLSHLMPEPASPSQTFSPGSIKERFSQRQAGALLLGLAACVAALALWRLTRP